MIIFHERNTRVMSAETKGASYDLTTKSKNELKKTAEIWNGQFDKMVQLKNQVTAKSTEEKIDRFDCIRNFLPDKFKQNLSKVRT